MNRATSRAFRIRTLGLALLVTGCAHGSGLSPRGVTATAPVSVSIQRDTSQVLVRVAGEPITRAMVQARIDSSPDQYKVMYATPDGRRQVLERMVEERVWMDQAIKNGVADRPKVKEQIEQQRRDMLIRTYLTERMAASPAPSDSELKVYYDAHAAEYHIPASVTLRHIQLKSAKEAQSVLKLAKSGKDFAALAAKYSADTLTRRNGGLLGTVSRDGVFASLGAQPALAESALTLTAGAIGGPWQTSHGWHVVKVESVRSESTRPFDQVKPMIQRQIGSQRSQDYYKKLLEDARRSLDVTADSAAIKGFLSQRRSEADMFKEAQETSGPNERIAAYRQLLEEFPNGEKAAQSLFMIGFIYSEELKNYPEADKAFREVLRRFPNAELAASAQWMVDHMRTEDAPAFVTQEADSSRPVLRRAGAENAKSPKPGSSDKP
jgi:peptidyl-prolyl cis-trans isomerase C